MSQPTSAGPGEGSPTHLQSRGTLSEPTNNQQNTKINSSSLLPNTWLVQSTLCQVSPATTLFLSHPTLAGPRGGNPPFCNPGGPYQSIQTTSDTPKSTVYLCCQIHVKYEALLAQYHHLHCIAVSAYLNWTHLQPRGTPSEPPNN